MSAQAYAHDPLLRDSRHHQAAAARELAEWLQHLALADSSGCLIWQGSKLKSGYGRVPGSRLLAHRYVYTKAHGEIPVGMVVMHTCDQPSCVNPDHLNLGTQADNMADAKAKGRIRSPRAEANILKTYCVNGHPYDEANTYVRRDGKRFCRTCQRERMRRSRRSG